MQQSAVFSEAAF